MLWRNKFILFFFLSALLLLMMAGMLALVNDSWKPIRSDGFGHYIYLPSTIIHQNLEHSDTLVSIYGENFGGRGFFDGVRELENGNYFSKYPFGTAILMLPLFLSAHLLAHLLPFWEADGYSFIYQLAMVLSAISYFGIGSYFIHKLIEKRFVSQSISYISLSTLLFGTNIIHYIIFDTTYSHIYAFAVFSALLYVCDNYLIDSYSRKWWLVAAALVGLLVIIRNAHIVFAILPFLALTERLLKKNISIREYSLSLLLGFVTGLAFVSTMLLYWGLVTGDPLKYSYGNESFDFLAPQFDRVFLDINNGMFIWHPLLLIAVAGIIYSIVRQKDRLVTYSLPIVLVIFYIYASWWAPSLGFSFGYRGATDLYPIFTIGFAYFFSLIAKSKFKLLNAVTIAIILFFLLQNMIQLNNHWRGIIYGNLITWELYKDVYLRPCIDVSIDILRCD
ncbi:MAG: hypothetical protein ACOCXP_00820 [Candidatus Dojkabacteria bacterium]